MSIFPKYSQKLTMDNNTLLFLYARNPPLAVHRDYLQTSFYDPLIKQRVTREEYYNRINLGLGLLTTLYKNNSGVWININDITLSEQRTRGLFDLANDFRIFGTRTYNSLDIPATRYIDMDGKEFFIQQQDGIERDRIFPFRIGRKDYETDYVDLYAGGFKATLEMHNRDIRVKTYTTTADNTLVTLNGLFVEPLLSTSDSNTFYIRNAAKIVGTEIRKYKNPGEIVISKDKRSYRLKHDPRDGIWFMNEKIQMFKWKDVNISPFVVPYYSGFDEGTYISYLEQTLFIPTTYRFRENIVDREFIVFINNKIIPPDYYRIVDGKLQLLQQKLEAIMLLMELHNNNVRNPLRVLRASLRFNLRIAFVESSNPLNKIKLRWEDLPYKNFPYIGDVYAPNYKLGDLLIMNGEYFPDFYQKNTGYIHIPFTKRFQNEANRLNAVEKTRLMLVYPIIIPQ